MPMLVVDPIEVGNRIRLVRKYAAGMTGRTFAEAMGTSDTGLASRLEKGELNHRWIERVGHACAGKGMLRDTTPEEIRAFLEGRIDELHVVLDGQFNQMSYFGQVLVERRRVDSDGQTVAVFRVWPRRAVADDVA